MTSISAASLDGGLAGGLLDGLGLVDSPKSRQLSLLESEEGAFGKLEFTQPRLNKERRTFLHPIIVINYISIFKCAACSVIVPPQSNLIYLISAVIIEPIRKDIFYTCNLIMISDFISTSDIHENYSFQETLGE
jgi:hypothetical protein